MPTFDDVTLELVVRTAADLFHPSGGAAKRSSMVQLAALVGSGMTTITRHAESHTVVVVVQPDADPRPTPEPFCALSTRECEVAALLAAGLSNREIATELFVSVATVKDHVHHILTKTGLANRAAVAGRWRAAAAC